MKSLVGMMTEVWSEGGSRLQVSCDSSGDFSRARVELETRQAATALANLDIGIGDRVLLVADSSFDFVRACIASLRLGAVVVPVNPGSSYKEIEHAISLTKPAAFYCSDDSVALQIFAMADRNVNRGGFDGPGSALPRTDRSMVRFENWKQAGYEPVIDQVGPTDLAFVMFTSGTTGAPKGAMITHGGLASNLVDLSDAWSWTESDHLILSLPIFHMHGLGIGVLGTLTLGGSLALLARFDPSRVAEVAQGSLATAFFGVPTMYQRLLQSSNISGLARLRLIVSGSAPMSARLHEELYLRLNQYVLERYGLTESGLVTSNSLLGRRIPGTVGGPLPSVSVRLDEPSGEILLKCPSMFDGYIGNPSATTAAFDDSGWFRTGDSGVWHDSSHLKISGRLKDLIITGGFNVFPGEVEAVLRDYPGVEDVAVVGVDSELWGEEVVAFVVGTDRNDAALKSYLEHSVAKYKVPKRFVYVDSLPKNVLGKVLYSELRDSL